VRKAKEGEVTADIFAFLIYEPNGRVHPKAIPVILTSTEEHDVWMRAPCWTRPRRCSDLASRLRCRKCAKAGRRPPATLLQLAWQPRHPRTEA
jgi:hypothetical protein